VAKSQAELMNVATSPLKFFGNAYQQLANQPITPFQERTVRPAIGAASTITASMKDNRNAEIQGTSPLEAALKVNKFQQHPQATMTSRGSSPSPMDNKGSLHGSGQNLHRGGGGKEPYSETKGSVERTRSEQESPKGICRSFERTQECKFGDKCKFLHVARPASLSGVQDTAERSPSDRILRSASKFALPADKVVLLASMQFEKEMDEQDVNQFFYDHAEEWETGWQEEEQESSSVN